MVAIWSSSSHGVDGGFSGQSAQQVPGGAAVLAGMQVELAGELFVAGQHAGAGTGWERAVREVPCPAEGASSQPSAGKRGETRSTLARARMWLALRSERCPFSTMDTGVGEMQVEFC